MGIEGFKTRKGDGKMITLLEDAIKAGKMHLERMSNLALLNDYQKFRTNKVVGQALLKEMRRRGGFRIVEKIDTLEKTMIIIREKVQENPEKRGELWPRYSALKKELAMLDPYDEQIDIGILGKPLDAGFADQE
jgi:hypothetical protein